jgi:23S rRNA maturation mini-RNase III
MKSHTILAKQFEVRANQIEYNLVLLEREQRTKKSIEEIRIIHEKFSRIKSNSIPKITKATGHNFSYHNFFLFVFLYREINAVFNEAQTNPVNAGAVETLSLPELKDMCSVSEDRLTLAYIGDAALELAVIASIWPPDSTEIPSKQFLHDERNKLVENIPLSHYWDSMELYDPAILIQPSNENSETKGSYMEAVFGIIYLEGGLEAVEIALKNLIENSKTLRRVQG